MPAEIVKSEPGAVERVPLTVMEMIAQLAVDPRVDVAKLHELMDLQDRVQAKEARAEFWAAMARLAPKLPRITKRGKIALGGKGEISYARYEDIDAVCRPLLAAEGLTASFTTRVGPTGGVVMVLIVAHTSGHSETSERPAPPDQGPGRNATQAQGSGEAYAKRYLFNAFFNIITEGQDDDGRATGFVTDKQVDELSDVIHQLGAQWTAARQEKFLAWLGTDRLSHINASDFRKAMTFLEQKAREGK